MQGYEGYTRVSRLEFVAVVVPQWRYEAFKLALYTLKHQSLDTTKYLQLCDVVQVSVSPTPGSRAALPVLIPGQRARLISTLLSVLRLCLRSRWRRFVHACPITHLPPCRSVSRSLSGFVDRFPPGPDRASFRSRRRRTASLIGIGPRRRPRKLMPSSASWR